MAKLRDGETTKSRVVQAAEELFAANGFNGASLRMISERSGYSEGLILHHFRSKNNLYRAVRENASRAYIEFLKESLSGTAEPAEMIKRTILAAFRYFTDHPSYIRLVWWAWLEGQELFSENERALTLKTLEVVRSSQQQGLVKGEAEPQVIIAVLLGAIHYWVTRGPLLRDIGEMICSAQRSDELFVDGLIRLLLE